MQIEKEILLQAENVNKVAMLYEECVKPGKRGCVQNVTLDMVTTSDIYLMNWVS